MPNKPARAALLSAFLLAAAFELRARDLDLGVRQTEKGLFLINIALRNRPNRQIINSLTSNLRPRIVYEVRIYQKRQDWLSFLGDRVVFQEDFTYQSGLDLLSGRPVIIQNQKKRFFGDPEDFLTAFFRLQEKIAFAPVLPPNDYYFMVRARVLTFGLDSPFGFAAFFTNNRLLVTPWQKQEIGSKKSTAASPFTGTQFKIR